MKKALLFALPLIMFTAPAFGQSGAAYEAKYADASIDRGFIVSHAETLGEGEIALNSYELALAGISYGITDDLQVTLTTLLPIVKNTPIVLAPQVKWAFFRTDNQVLTAKMNFNYATMPGESGGGGSISGGLSHDFYFDNEGRYGMFSGFDIGGVFGHLEDDWDTGDGLIMAANLGFSAQVTDYMKVMAEGILPAVYSNGKVEVSEIVNFTYGLRFFGDDLAADIGFIRPLGKDAGDLDLVMGVPYVAFTARI